jgi:hypothetical protein
LLQVLRHINFIIVLVVGLLVCVACFFPRLGDRWFRLAEAWGARFARRKTTVVVSIALATVLVRVALLGVMPVPLPCYGDEFCYLLAADTFDHGRLTNPSHPMWLFLETFHQLQHPTYSSMYPPAQGGALALGQALGNPWIGVLLSMGLMAAAITWALQGWLPARWALLGGIILFLRIGFISYWMNSYWGGAIPATGGALVIGALPRIWKRLRIGDVLLMAVGAGLLANSRPFEGAIFCVPVALAMIVWLFSKRGPAPAVALGRVFVPLAAVLIPTLAFIGYYNWRVTGDALVFPEALDLKLYTNHLFLWQLGRTPLHYNNPQFEEYYNVFAYNAYPRTMGQGLIWKSHILWVFYFGSALTIPLITLPWVIRNKRMRFLAAQVVISMAGALAVSPFFPHYAAPLTATLLILLMQTMRHLRLWKASGRPIGVVLCRLIVLLTIARVPYAVADHHRDTGCPWGEDRARITRQLDVMPGKQLVIVRYSSKHNIAIEWVYNRADVDGAKIVWAREIPGRSVKPLLDYYRDRKVWLLEADVSPVSLRPYDGDVMSK